MRIFVHCAALFLLCCTSYFSLSIRHLEYGDTVKSLADFCLLTPDSIPVFSTVPFQLITEGKQKKGIVLLNVKSNRLWSGADSILEVSNLSDSAYFDCSFTDTGKKTVECIYVSPSGTMQKITRDFNVYLPLHPEIITVGQDSLVLSTPSVSDSVQYIWEFDNGITVCNSNSRVVLPLSEKYTYSGKLYVKCQEKQSPGVRFTFNDFNALFSDL